MHPEKSFHRPRFAPITILTAAFAVGIAVMIVVTLIAQHQPWLGLNLKAPAEGEGVIVQASQGPSSSIPAGTRLLSIENDEDRIDLEAFDLTVEPDGAMGDYESYARFLERQSRLARIQASESVTFTDEQGQQHRVQPVTSGRPLLDLPVDFWVQCLVGLIAWLVSAAVFAFRSSEASARYLLLSGASTLLFAPAAASYTTRELSVPGEILRWASDLNFLGGSLFAASFVALLLVYPRRIAPKWIGPVVVTLFSVWFVAQQLGCFESMTFARRFLVMLGVLATFVLAAVHWRISGRNPLARARLQWFLLSWVVGTSTFSIFILLPQMFGADTSPIQGYAFLLFLLVYSGLAFGILRYRLFDLGDWWRRVMAWAVAVLILVVLDLFFLYGLQLSTGTSLTVTLLLCGLVWLPLRSWMWNRFAVRNRRQNPVLFQRVVDVALAPPGQDSESERWIAVMQTVFEPLEIQADQAVESTRTVIQDDGLSLALPSIGRLPALKLKYAQSGRQLFHPRDAALADELRSMLQHAYESLSAYEKGVAEERKRIARDMHDNIGAQLLSALHSTENTAKDARIRDSLADLRAVINQSSEQVDSLRNTLADLRIETVERLDSVGIESVWEATGTDTVLAVRPGLCHAVRSILREATSNAIRHAKPSRVSICFELSGDQLRIVVQDNGCGFDPKQSASGNGLRNIRSRVEALDGHLDLRSLDTGTRLEVRIPLWTTPPVR